MSQKESAQTYAESKLRSPKLLALTICCTLALSSCSFGQSESYKMGYSDGQDATQMSVTELLGFTGGVCEDLATMAKDYYSLDNFSRSDYIQGCTDGFNSMSK